MTNVPNSYDVVPYLSLPYAQSHPSRLATIATLFGMRPQPIERCRVLELGCAAGGNILPLAEQLPGSRFLGVDLSQRQIDEGRARAESLEVSNLELRQEDMRQFAAETGEFDYIIAHGVFSWVPKEAQEELFRICARHLAPQGVAYISYNTYPGWRLKESVRDIFLFRSRKFSDPRDRARHAREFLNFLSQAVPTKDHAYGMLLKSEFDMLREQDDWYLTHDHLETNNLPVLFHQFMERAEAHGLQYLGESDLRSMSISNFSKGIETVLRDVSEDLIELEQYMDFVRNRTFRQTLLCRREVALDRGLGPERIQSLSVASGAQPEGGKARLSSNEQVTFRGPISVLKTSEPLVKSAMVELAHAWPQAIPFPQLLAGAQARLRKRPVEEDARSLAEPLLRCYATSLIELWYRPLDFTKTVSERPLASRLARLEAQAGVRVTNRRHETVVLSDVERFLLQELDGTHDGAAVVELLLERTRRGDLSIKRHGSPVEADDELRAILRDAVESSLPRLGQQALLVA